MTETAQTADADAAPPPAVPIGVRVGELAHRAGGPHAHGHLGVHRKSFERGGGFASRGIPQIFLAQRRDQLPHLADALGSRIRHRFELSGRLANGLLSAGRGFGR